MATQALGTASGTSLGIRYAVPVDLVSVQAVVHAAYRHYVDRIGVRPRPMDVDYEELMRRGSLFVAGSPAVATVTLVPEESGLYLDNLAVAPDLQGRGIGRRLLAFAEDHARELWLPQVTLVTNVMMWENQRMYTAAGYEECARSAPAPGFERIHYRKPVATRDWDRAAATYLPPAGTVARTSPARSASPGSHRRVM